MSDGPAQDTPLLCPEEGLLAGLLGPLQVGLGVQHLLQLAVFAREGAHINGLLHNQDGMTEGLAHGPLLSKVELIFAPLAVNKVVGENKDHLGKGRTGLKIGGFVL